MKVKKKSCSALFTTSCGLESLRYCKSICSESGFQRISCLNHCLIISGLIKANFRRVVWKKGDIFWWQHDSLQRWLIVWKQRRASVLGGKKKKNTAMSPWWHSEATETGREEMECVLIAPRPLWYPLCCLRLLLIHQERCCTCKGALSLLQRFK